MKLHNNIIVMATVLAVCAIFYRNRHPPSPTGTPPAPTCRVPMIGSSAVPATTSTETLLGGWSGGNDTSLKIDRHGRRQAFIMHLRRGSDLLTCEFTVMWRPRFDPELEHDPYRAWCNGLGMPPGTPATITFTHYQGSLLGVKVDPANLYMEFFR